VGQRRCIGRLEEERRGGRRANLLDPHWEKIRPRSTQAGREETTSGESHSESLCGQEREKKNPFPILEEDLYDMFSEKKKRRCLRSKFPRKEHYLGRGGEKDMVNCPREKE